MVKEEFNLTDEQKEALKRVEKYRINSNCSSAKRLGRIAVMVGYLAPGCCINFSIPPCSSSSNHDDSFSNN